MKRVLYAAALIGLVVSAAIAGLGQSPGARYDQQIFSNVARILADNPQFKDVTVQVEDGVVTLGGSVESESLRRDLMVRISHVHYVVEVVDQTVLYPPPLPEHIL